MRARPDGRRDALRGWWESSCRHYLREIFGDAGEEIRQTLAETLFPPRAEPSLPEQVLPVSFLHLRLLAGEELGAALGRVKALAALHGSRDARPTVGLLYLMLTALTSRPGKLSSMAEARAAFFSLLLRRAARMLDDGADEDAVREELAGVWEVGAETAADATLEGARGLWRRCADSRLGLGVLSAEMGARLAEDGVAGSVAAARKRYREVGERHHLAEILDRLAAMEGLGAAVESAGCAARKRGLEEARTRLARSLAGALDGLTPWESGILRPAPAPLFSLLAWARRLRLLDGGETPTAYPGRERLPDWLRDFLGRETARGGVLASARLTVGGGTYIVAGVDAQAPSALLSAVELGAPARAAPDALCLRVRFGDGAEKSFPFRLDDGKDLLAALYLADQDDVRLDVIVRGADGRWRFGTSRYLGVSPEHRSAWRRWLFAFLAERFGGDESRVRLEILRGTRRGGRAAASRQESGAV